MPSDGALISCSIFIASRMSNGVPAVTSAPGLSSSFSTTPGICEVRLASLAEASSAADAPSTRSPRKISPSRQSVRLRRPAVDR